MSAAPCAPFMTFRQILADIGRKTIVASDHGLINADRAAEK